MGSPIPAWGLFRLLKAVESRGTAGTLQIGIAGGTVTLALAAGRPYAASTRLAALSFSRFLKRTRGAARGDAATPKDLTELGMPPEDVARLQQAHLKGVLSVVLPSPVSEWTHDPEGEAPWAVRGPSVEVTAELMRAVAAFPDCLLYTSPSPRD